MPAFQKIGNLFSKDKNPENKDFGSQSSGFDSLKNVPFAGDTEIIPTEEQKEQHASQQNKLIYGILHDGYQALTDPAIAERADRNDRQEFLERINNGLVTDNEERNFLNLIQDPVHKVGGAEAIFERNFAGQKHQKRILAAMTEIGFTNYEQVSATEIESFLRQFPMPMDFEEISSKFLTEIKASNPETKFNEYSAAMEQFKHSIYGKRQEYHEQFKILKEEAANIKSSETNPVDTPAEKQLQIDPEIRAELLSHAKIDGDPWIQNGNKYNLTPDILERFHLGPEYKVDLDDKEIGLSKIFKVNNRESVIGYVKTETGEVKVRSYYRSSSQGLWRYLPDYVGGDGNIAWYGKGYNEEALTLPGELQESLSNISKSPDGVCDFSAEEINPAFLLAGTAKRYSSKDQYCMNLASGTMRGDFYLEVDLRPIKSFGEQKSNYKTPPEKLDISGSLAPDFSHETSEWKMQTNLYGEVTAKCFDSEDGTLSYMFCQQKDNEAWLGGIESRSEVTSLGLRKSWVSAGDIATPLLEYSVQSSGYGTEEPGRKDRYVNMWSKYLSKAPLIQKYLASESDAK